MVLALLAIISLHVTNAQFIEQPSAGLVFVPANDQINLSCLVSEDFRVNWEVRIDGVPLEAARTTFRATFEQHGFTFTGVATTSSTVSFGNFDIAGNQTNNATVVTCLAQQGISEQNRGNEIQVIFYSAPPSPTDLNVTKNELDSFSISWSLGFIEGVPVNYTLTVLNLNTTSAQPIIIAGLLDQHYVFETNRPCDVYSFTVTAVTAAGNSTPSQEIIFTDEDKIEMCSVTMPGSTADTATTAANSPAPTGGVVTGIVIGVVLAIIVCASGIIALISLWKCVLAKQGRSSICNRKGHDNQSQGPEEITASQQQLFSTAVDTSNDEKEEEMAVSLKLDPTADATSLTAEIVPYKELDCADPEGLATFKNEVLLLDKKKEGIVVFESLKQSNLVKLDRSDLSAITVDTKTGNLFVTTGATGKLLKLSNTGKIIHSKGNFKFSNGLRIDSRNKLYVCDSGRHQILVYDLYLNLLKTITGKDKKCKPFQTPRDVDFDKHNNIYVAESRRIQVLLSNGEFFRMIGEGKILDAISLKIKSNNIFVANHGEACISIFTTDGQHIQDFNKDNRFYDRPMSVTIDQNGYVYISTLRGKLYIFEHILTK